MRTNACKRGDHHECQGCNGCDCHGGGMPADFRDRVAKLRDAAEAGSVAAPDAEDGESGPEGRPVPSEGLTEPLAGEEW